MSEKGPCYVGRVFPALIHEEIQAGHGFVANLPGELIQCICDMRILAKGGESNDGRCVIGWEVVSVILENDEAEGDDAAIGGESRDDIDVSGCDGLIHEAEVHSPSGLERDPVRLLKTGKPVRPNQKFLRRP